MHVCVCMVLGVGAQKKVSNFLKLELQLIVSPPVGAGSQIWVLYKRFERRFRHFSRPHGKIYSDSIIPFFFDFSQQFLSNRDHTCVCVHTYIFIKYILVYTHVYELDFFRIQYKLHCVFNIRFHFFLLLA